jgi:carboxyl-terminal processing protease
MKRISILLITLFLLFGHVSCGRVGVSWEKTQATLTPTATPWPTASAERRSQYLETFDAVWQAVNELYFDPTFGGKDWKAIGDQYRLQMAVIQDDEKALLLLNQMLFELGVSHIVALPISMANQMEPIGSAVGWAGLDLRMLDGQVVVIWVATGSDAEKAGVRPGDVITAVDGMSIEEISKEGLQTPPYNERNQPGNKLQKIRQMLYGEIGKVVGIEFLDEKGRSHQQELVLVGRPGKFSESVEGLPPMYTEVEAYQLKDGIGYLRFSAFLPGVLEEVLAAIDRFQATPALIIDLRSNPGGVFPVRKAIAEKLVGDPVLFFKYRTRNGVENVYLERVADAYEGKLVILIDELSASSSEEFSGGMQSIGRATIIGNQSPGRCLAADVRMLPNDFILMVPTRQSQTPDGHVLEYNGVTPDIAVSLEREKLMRGIDTQLEAAIQYLQEQMGK